MNRSAPRRQIERPIAVAVEGRDYLYAILARIRDDPTFADVQLWDFCEPPAGTPKQWLGFLRTLRGYDERVRAVGLIRDAEDSADASQAELRAALEDNELVAPPEVLTITAGPPATGYLVMPHGQAKGCLENAMLDAARADTPIACARDFLACVDRPAKNDNWRAKVQVHALIAGGEKPPMTLGESVNHGELWDFAHPSLAVMIDFISALVGAATPAA